MKVSSCKNKGRRLQQKVRDDILRVFNSTMKDDDVTSTSMGCGGEDLKFSPHARSIIPISIECKNQERLDLWGSLLQCSTNAPSGTTPCLIFKRNHTKTYAVVDWEHLLNLYYEVYTRKQNEAFVNDEKTGRVKELIAELNSLIN